jgi:hypothetical protein
MIIARNLVQGNAQRRLPGSIGCTDSPGGEERAPVEIGLDDQHHVLTTGGPPMKLVATLARSLQADMETELREIELAVAAGMQGAGRALKTELRRQVASAGLGQRVANSWRDRHYPNQKLDAASVVYTKAPQIIRAFDEGAVIRSNRGRFLAIPTENAPRKAPMVSGSARAPSRSTGLDHSDSCLDQADRRFWWWMACVPRSTARPGSSGGSGVQPSALGAAGRG